MATSAWCGWRCLRTWLATSLGSLLQRERWAGCRSVDVAVLGGGGACRECVGQAQTLTACAHTRHAACWLQLHMLQRLPHSSLTLCVLLCCVYCCAAATAQTQGQEVDSPAGHVCSKLCVNVFQAAAAKEALDGGCSRLALQHVEAWQLNSRVAAARDTIVGSEAVRPWCPSSCSLELLMAAAAGWRVQRSTLMLSSIANHLQRASSLLGLLAV